MAEKGEIPPVYPGLSQLQPARDRKWLLSLLFYAGAVTAALVVTATLGSIYMAKLERTCGPQSPDAVNGPLSEPKEIIRDGERMVVDPVANKEVIYPSGEGLQGSILVIDHNKGLISMYMAARDECFLIGGVDRRLPNATELLAALQGEQTEESTDRGHGVTLNYVKASDWPVQDLTLLPRELHAPCWGKPVFWLERQNEEETPLSRDKRAANSRPIWPCCWCFFCRWHPCRCTCFPC